MPTAAPVTSPNTGLLFCVKNRPSGGGSCVLEDAFHLSVKILMFHKVLNVCYHTRRLWLKNVKVCAMSEFCRIFALGFGKVRGSV